MSPRYREVEIPESLSEEFEAYITQHGGSIRAKLPSAEEMTEAVGQAWQKHIQPARHLLEQFHNPPPEFAEEIHNGVKKLVSDLISMCYSRSVKHYDRPVRNPIDYTSVEETLCRVLTACLPDNPPQGVWTLDGKTIRRKTIKSAPREVLLPQDIVLLCERYGLADGQQKEMAELVTHLGQPKSTLANRFRRGMSTLGDIPEINNVILKPKER